MSSTTHKNGFSNGVGSIKRTLIDKSNNRSVVVVSVAVFVVVFSLVAVKTLWSQAAYQNRVLAEKNTAKKQLAKDLEVVKKLQPSYQAFVGTTTNIIGGNSVGTGERDGDNAKIILDALPSKYDFPGLTTNLEKIATDQGVDLIGITGTDDEVNQASNASSSNPQPVEMPFQITISADYAKTQAFVNALERSIRPIKVTSIDISASNGKMSTVVSAVTYYQPAKSLNTRTKVVQ